MGTKKNMGTSQGAGVEQAGAQVIPFPGTDPAKEQGTGARVDALLKAVAGPVVRVKAEAGQIQLTTRAGVTEHSPDAIEQFAKNLLAAVMLARFQVKR